MKSIKNHLMFMLPLLAILLGIEFFLIFGRLTNAYEEKLKDSYSVLVVSQKEVGINEFKAVDDYIASAQKMSKNEIIQEIGSENNSSDTDVILGMMPNFYTLKLTKYLDTSSLEKLRQELISSGVASRVETFEGSYNTNYKLFKFIKFLLNSFIVFMSIVSLFLVIKQLEVWGFVHKERMQVMQIFGAPLMLRSGILFRVAFLDAILATLIIIAIFAYFSYSGIYVGGIDIVEQNSNLLFLPFDAAILFGSAFLIVVIAVYSVVSSASGKEV